MQQHTARRYLAVETPGQQGVARAIARRYFAHEPAVLIFSTGTRIARAGGMHTTAPTTIEPRASAVDRAWDQADSSLDGAPPGHDFADGRSLRSRAERRARTLGYFSLALGVAQLTLSGPMARLIGLKDTARSRRALRAIGAREIASGIGLLARQRSSGPVWSRVAGDAVDLALLGTSLSDNPANRARLVAVSAAVAGITTLDVLSAARLSRHEAVQKLALPVHVVRSITINRPPETVYHFWRDLENLPRFMAHLESVRKNEDGTSVWRVKAPLGLSIEWQAEITLDRPNESLAWRSLEGASIPNRGVVRFKPGPAGRGTEVLVELKYDPPGGALAAAVAKLFGEEPGQQIAGDLRRLKQVLETGSIVHSDASIHRGLHAARPAAEGEPVTILGKDEA